MPVHQVPERHFEFLRGLRKPALGGSQPCPVGRDACLLCREHAGDLGRLRAAETLASLHHVLGGERGAELRFGERKLRIGDAVELCRLGIDALRLGVGNLGRLERMATAEIDELGGDVVADPAERGAFLAALAYRQLGRGQVICIDFGERALVVEHESFINAPNAP